MALPCGTTGSLCSSFLPVRLVCLPVKRACAITLCGRLPIGLSAPFEASVTLLEATTPVKLPTKQCPLKRELETKCAKVSISTSTPQELASLTRCLLTILHIAHPVTVLSCSKGSRGLFRPVAGNRHLHRYYNFTEFMVETVSRSLHHSCRSELTRQGISLP